MCVSCGCGKHDDDHGDDRHLTMDDIRQAADAADIGADQVARNIQEAVGQPAGAPRE